MLHEQNGEGDGVESGEFDNDGKTGEMTQGIGWGGPRFSKLFPTAGGIRPLSHRCPAC